MGMIETRPWEGTFVCRRSDFLSRPILWAITGSDPSSAKELVEARRLMEVELAGLAAERATAGDLKGIGEHLDRMEASMNDMLHFQESDINFRLAVGQAAHNRILRNAMDAYGIEN